MPGSQWWLSNQEQLRHHIDKREPMPDVARLYTLYVRYGASDAVVANAWERGSAPLRVSMGIVEAPAEFCMPVKQDRRLCPAFKVRVDVSSTQPFSLPITVKAQCITQQQKDNLIKTVPEDAKSSGEDKGAKGFTELKGTTQMEHLFTANLGSHNDLSTGLAAASTHPSPRQSNTNSATLPSLPHSGPLPPAPPAPPVWGAPPGMDVAAMSNPNLALSSIDGHTLERILMDADLMQVQPAGGDAPMQQAAPAQATPMQEASPWEQLNTSSHSKQALINPFQHQQLLQPGQLPSAGNSGQLLLPTGLVTTSSQQRQQQSGLLLSVGGLATTASQQQPALLTSSHDFAFPNIELLKPTRMNHVYMMFTCTLFETDVLMLLYHVPTIGICRAEQRVKACTKLGIPTHWAGGPDCVGGPVGGGGGNNGSSSGGLFKLDPSAMAGAGGVTGVVAKGDSGMGGGLLAVGNGARDLGDGAANGSEGRFKRLASEQVRDSRGAGGHVVGPGGLQLPDRPHQRTCGLYPRPVPRAGSRPSNDGSGFRTSAGTPYPSSSPLKLPSGLLPTVNAAPGFHSSAASLHAPHNGDGSGSKLPTLMHPMGLALLSSMTAAPHTNGNGNEGNSGPLHPRRSVGGHPATSGADGGSGSLPMPLRPFGTPYEQPAAMQCMLGGMAGMLIGDDVSMPSLGGGIGTVGSMGGGGVGGGAMDVGGGGGGGGLGNGVGGGGRGSPPALSWQAMRDWVHDEYETMQLTRKLTGQDVQALLSQAGFPTGIQSDHVVISHTQGREFQQQFLTTLQLLRQIAHVWNMQDPCVIAGFDMDRHGTVQALAAEPDGTFICRFSMSQPGCLVLSCKTALPRPGAGADNLMHAIIKLQDLYERRVDAWIHDYSDATHVLDVYRGRRVDKERVFALPSLQAINSINNNTTSQQQGLNNNNNGFLLHQGSINTALQQAGLNRQQHQHQQQHGIVALQQQEQQAQLQQQRSSMQQDHQTTLQQRASMQEEQAGLDRQRSELAAQHAVQEERAFVQHMRSAAQREQAVRLQEKQALLDSERAAMLQQELSGTLHQGKEPAPPTPGLGWGYASTVLPPPPPLQLHTSGNSGSLPNNPFQHQQQHQPGLLPAALPSSAN